MSKGRGKSIYEYTKKNYDKVTLLLPKGYLDILKQHANSHGESINQFVKQAVFDRIASDGGITCQS